MKALETQVSTCRDRLAALEREIGKVFVGHEEVVEQVLLCLFSRGHLLLEGVPGVGKTLLVKALSRALDLSFARIQCTPDLMPADVVGTNVLVEGGGGEAMRFQPGPLFANIVLVDEINRATPKTQSAFLEAMQEGQVTTLGVTHALEKPFLLMATQNPIEMEGTYPLPEAQLDRFFFKLELKAPDFDELSRIMDLTTGEAAPEVEPVCDAQSVAEISTLARRVKVAEEVKGSALRLVTASHPESPDAPDAVRQYVKYGASPRAAQSMILAGKVRALAEGRYNVSHGDIAGVARPALRHRLIMNFEGEVEGVTADDVVSQLLAHLGL